MKNIFRNCVMSIFLSLIVCSWSMRVKRRAGDQAPPGLCSTYKWGGSSGLHWYICCNNCNQTITSCDGRTYQSASSGAYCGKCGIDTKAGDGKKHKTYACGGCPGQDRVRKKCLSNFHSINKVPGFCWAFAKCFKSKCKAVRRRSTTETCFNLMCEPGETVENCPTDCCGTTNKKCDWNNTAANFCPPECCGDSTCCSDISGVDGLVAGKTESLLKYFFTSVIVLIVMKPFPFHSLQ